MPITYYTKQEVESLLHKQRHEIFELLFDMGINGKYPIPIKQGIYAARKAVIDMEIIKL